MTDDAGTTRTAPRSILRRLPVTLLILAALLAAGVATGALWAPFQDSPLWHDLAYGLPALADGRWWTPVTGTFLAAQPPGYLLLVACLLGVAYLEWHRGWRMTLAWFAGGQLFAILATAGLLWLLSVVTPAWPWVQHQAAALDVGPSGGLLACIAVAVGVLPSPWRNRAWLTLLTYVFIALLFWGDIADLEHTAAVVLVLAVDRSLTLRRATVREQRLLAFWALIVLIVISTIVDYVPTSGPFGDTVPSETLHWSVLIDVVITLLVVNGLRRGRRWAWLLSLLYAVLNVLLGGLIVLLLMLSAGKDLEDLGLNARMAVATSILWVLFLIMLLIERRAFRWRRRPPLGGGTAPTRDDVILALQQHGGGTLSWMTTWEPNEYLRTAGGIVAYQRHNGVALALADPIGDPSDRAKAVTEFIERAERAGTTPCFFSADDATRAAVPEGWQSLVVADDTIVDLPGLEFTGKRWGAIRTATNRAQREGVTFTVSKLADERWGVRAQLQAISELWVGDKDLPEMRFTLGTLAEAEDPHVRVAIATAENGDVEGFLSWLPVYGPEGAVRGWTLDLMRRRPGGFPPVMEYLIGMSAAAFRDEGAEFLSLSGAPLTHDYPPEAGAIAALSTRLSDLLEPVYGFKSLHRFKEKFHPRYETLHLLYRETTDLPRIGVALTQAFLPGATLRQYAAAGLDLVKRDDE
ncbi:bifunctional lysylphosphatidylglycerol flippase/synthetase MprF [Microbacterium sp. NPDC057659]|uniref:bifunctional lysylphosphatidylglycerol flippase/synthetase MprF n=1 Tax=Microbacterium sp. NPDC057659 TaxID=3346198 RepID=UPI00366B2312